MQWRTQMNCGGRVQMPPQLNFNVKKYFDLLLKLILKKNYTSH